MFTSQTTTQSHTTCPCATDSRCWTAHVVADHSEQGWVRLCNGVVVFDDHYYLTPDGHSEPIPVAA
ncbi:DUF5999 family protein [Nocardioides marmoribigeumensis]|uniref:Uncharacterized protein n=1 Tax=Nocardioides marmoribigeumensis TaxID=433649 RepID=A0ABU2BV49_9ACTN|nr:DUF5999 family protein [Nocardioides marmoribigeumensis]MDR7361904.1 hypothetical protein [Nocardioides marmoribigeumensis]